MMINLRRIKECAEKADQDGDWQLQKDNKRIVDRRFIVAECQARYPRCFSDAKHIANCDPQTILAMVRIVQCYKRLAENLDGHDFILLKRRAWGLKGSDAEGWVAGQVLINLIDTVENLKPFQQQQGEVE